MKGSIYNNFVVYNGRVYVYNTKYMNSVSFDTDDIKEVKQFLSCSNYAYLKDHGFLADIYEADEEYDWYMKLKYSTRSLDVMLIMTYNCNCACQYCFENLDKSLENVEKGRMFETLSTIASIVKDYKIDDVKISFFGGEPLLEVDKIIEVCAFFKERNISVKFTVITNGTLLSREIALLLKKAGVVNYQITIDGLGDVHDCRRPLKTRRSSFDAIIHNIEAIKDLNVNVTIRVNIDDTNVEQIPLIVNTFQNDITNFYIAPVVGCLDTSFRFTLHKRAQNLKKAWSIIKNQKIPIVITPPLYAPCPYHSIQSAFYIDLLGNVYTCGGFVGKKEMIESTSNIKNKNYYKRIETMPLKKCFLCSFFPVCMGGCQFETHELGSHCQKIYLKEIYDEYFSKYAEQTKL